MMNTITLQFMLLSVILVLCLHDFIFKPKTYSKVFWVVLSMMQVGFYVYTEAYIWAAVWAFFVFVWTYLVVIGIKLNKQIRETKEEMKRLMELIEEGQELNDRRELWKDNR